VRALPSTLAALALAVAAVVAPPGAGAGSCAKAPNPTAPSATAPIATAPNGTVPIGTAPLTGSTLRATGAVPPLDRTSRTLEKWAARDPHDLARVEFAEVAALLEESFTVRRSSRDDVDLALLSLAGHCRRHRSLPAIDALHRITHGALEQRLNGRGGTGFAALIKQKVLDPDGDADARQRLAACDALAGHLVDSNVSALLEVAASDTSAEVRTAALSGLVGLARLEVTHALVDASDHREGDERTDARLLLAQHLDRLEREEELERAWSPDLRARLVTAALPMLVHPDWRVASRAARLARFCDFDAVAPRCIEALFTWERREGAQEDDPAGLVGMRRLRHELADVLKGGSRMNLGIDPRRWTQWWRAHLSGEQPRFSSRTVTPDFFGLQLRSGAVAFVIDASGSMDHPIPGKYAGSKGPTRFEEAVEQLENALVRLPEPAVVRVVLFSDGGTVWSDEARLVSDTSRSSIRKWLRRNPPKGGTNLSSGLEALLPRDRAGAVQPELIDVDTVVVLCDGETSEDARWARTWLETHNRSANLVFHCVQIGGSRAEALSELAERTGGQFVRVD